MDTIKLKSNPNNKELILYTEKEVKELCYECFYNGMQANEESANPDKDFKKWFQQNKKK